jgi:hypothetical protein
LFFHTCNSYSSSIWFGDRCDMRQICIFFLFLDSLLALCFNFQFIVFFWKLTSHGFFLFKAQLILNLELVIFLVWQTNLAHEVIMQFLFLHHFGFSVLLFCFIFPWFIFYLLSWNLWFRVYLLGPWSLDFIWSLDFTLNLDFSWSLNFT